MRAISCVVTMVTGKVACIIVAVTLSELLTIATFVRRDLLEVFTSAIICLYLWPLCLVLGSEPCLETPNTLPVEPEDPGRICCEEWRRNPSRSPETWGWSLAHLCATFSSVTWNWLRKRERKFSLTPATGLCNIHVFKHTFSKWKQCHKHVTCWRVFRCNTSLFCVRSLVIFIVSLCMTLLNIFHSKR